MTDQPPTLVTGATGFVGSAVVRSAAPSRPIREVSRMIAPGGRGPGDRMAADLTTSGGIAAALRGVRSVIHCVSYIGPDPSLAWRVNFEATRDLVAAARSQGVRSLVYVSTAAVYAPGPKRGADEQFEVSPSSEVSRSRLAAEQVVLAAGGVVIRPHLLYGVGDRWVIPLLARTAEASGLPGAGGTRVSLMDVDELARQIWELARRADAACPAAVFNAASGRPVMLRDVVARLDDVLEPSASLTDPPPLSTHQREMLSSDNWFTSSLRAAVEPEFRLTPPMTLWYAGALGRARRFARKT